MAADLVAHSRPAVIWCHMNHEGDLLTKLVHGSVQVAGSSTDDEREQAFDGFADGSIRVLVIKPKIGAFGLNWQHCSHVVTFASHSYEQYYQSIRRCWRFGQKNPVEVDIVASEGERYVSDNMARKAKSASAMFENLVKHMNNSLAVKNEIGTQNIQLPKWI